MNNSNEKMSWFSELFFDATESWFSADIACCDVCYDDFVSTWPAVYHRDLEFQKSGIPLDCFYSGSRLCEIYSEDEFWEGIKQIRCQHCGSSLTANIWPYNLPFDPPKGIEETLEELAVLAESTPFLVLSHPYAKQVLDYIELLSRESGFTLLDDPLYRGRTIKHDTYGCKEFGPPPKTQTFEGRYNHAGNPVLYLSSCIETCFHEINKPKEGIVAAEIKINAKMKILDLVVQSSSDGSILQALTWSSLISSPVKQDGWHKPEFVFTRFLADCARKAGFDAIKYHSVRIDKGFNIAILNSHIISKDITVGPIEKYTSPLQRGS